LFSSAEEDGVRLGCRDEAWRIIGLEGMEFGLRKRMSFTRFEAGGYRDMDYT
jgi:hypothetical protein